MTKSQIPGNALGKPSLVKRFRGFMCEIGFGEFPLSAAPSPAAVGEREGDEGRATGATAAGGWGFPPTPAFSPAAEGEGEGEESGAAGATAAGGWGFPLTPALSPAADGEGEGEESGAAGGTGLGWGLAVSC